MSHEQLSTALTDLEVGEDSASTFLTDRYRDAVDALSCAFNSSRRAAVVVGEGCLASNYVMQSFISGLPADVAVARIDEPCADPTEFMGRIIDTVGFTPNNMSLEDLEGIFTMFLSFQKSHRRRTVLCIDRAEESDPWVLDKICSLVEQEGESHTGLMIVLSGQAGLKEILREGPLSPINTIVGNRVVLPGFTLAETKQYIRQRLQTAGKAGLDQLFQYRAITDLHELSKGVPDDVSALVNRCLETAAAEGIDLVTAELVHRAHEKRKAAADSGECDANTVNMRGFRPRQGRLVFQITGEDVRELVLRRGHTLIGRSTLCDLRIDSSTVSRRHALISYTADGAMLVDLNSTNGTYVDGEKIWRHELQPGQTIEVGGTRIEYVVEAKDHDHDGELAVSRHARH